MIDARAAKSMPPGDDDLRGTAVRDLWTPLLVLDESALAHNIEWMAAWIAARGLEHMPHGKTTMAPELWRRQLGQPGTTGLSVATPWQLRVARDAGIRDVMLANQLTDPAAIRWVAEERQARGGRIWSWIDDLDAVALTEDALEAWEGEPLEVLVELGRPGGRTGARDADTAFAIAERIASSRVLTLAGVAGYEGAVARGRAPEADAAVRAFVDDLLALHRRLAPQYGVEDPIVTAGGSAYPDVVAEAFAPAIGTARLVLRSGAYVVHDEGFYQSISPFEGHGDDGLRAAARGIARVVSHPEPGLVLIDAGKRDFPYDEGLPVPLSAVTRDGRRVPLEGAETVKLNDQHGFVRIDPTAPIGLGDLVVFGLSHPCTMFDKWRVLPVVSSIDDVSDAVVVDLVETHF